MAWHPLKSMDRIYKYCAYQERSRYEVLLKLRKMECPDADSVVDELQSQGFLNEERFARAYVRGKFRQNNWGKMMIRQGLREKQVPEELATLALEEEIGPEEYAETALRLAQAKARQLPMWESDFQEREKLKAFLMRKGYGYDAIAVALSSLAEQK